MEIFLVTLIKFTSSSLMPEIETFWLLHENKEAARAFVDNRIREIMANSVYQFIRAEITMEDKAKFRAMFESIDRKLLASQGKAKSALN